jgi:STE24 endopeptidase
LSIFGTVVGLFLAEVVAFALLAGVCSRAAAELARRLPNPLVWLAYVHYGGLALFGTLSFLWLSGTGAGLVVASVFHLGNGVVATLFARLMSASGAAAVTLTGYLSIVPVFRAVRGIELRRAQAARSMGKYLFGIGALAVAGYTALEWLLSTTGSSAALFVAVFVGLFAWFAATPLVAASLWRTREPTETEASRLDAALSKASLSVSRSVVLVTDGAEKAEMTVWSLFGHRRLYVTDAMLDSFSEDATAAFVAISAGRVRSRRSEFNLVAAVVGLALALGALEGFVPPSIAVGGLLIVVTSSLWGSRRLCLRADDDAAARLGRAAIADALEQYADFYGVAPTAGRFGRLLSARESLGVRIGRLREGAP